MKISQLDKPAKSSLLGGLIFLGIGIITLAAYFNERKDQYLKLFHTDITLKKTSSKVPEDGVM